MYVREYCSCVALYCTWFGYRSTRWEVWLPAPSEHFATPKGRRCPRGAAGGQADVVCRCVILRVKVWDLVGGVSTQRSNRDTQQVNCNMTAHTPSMLLLCCHLLSDRGLFELARSRHMIHPESRARYAWIKLLLEVSLFTSCAAYRCLAFAQISYKHQPSKCFRLLELLVFLIGDI